MSDYTELDQKIVAAVRDLASVRVVRYGAICARIGHSAYSDGRDIDRRLQSLRKRGVLTYNSKTGWAAP